MYSSINFKTKKQLKEAVAAGKQVTIFQPNAMFDSPQQASDYTGNATLEGPHYPKPHSWYARVELRNGVIVKVS